MKHEIYLELQLKLKQNIDKINQKKGLINKLKGKNYYLEESIRNGFLYDSKRFLITCDTKLKRRNSLGREIIVDITSYDDNSLEGFITSQKEKKVVSKIKGLVHSISHRYHIKTGDLL